MILAGTLLVAPLVAVPSRRATLGATALAICVLAGAVAWTTYYRHFMPVYAELAKRSAVALPDQPAPVQRAEAHQTHWVPGWIPLRNRIAAVPGYVAKYFGWPALLLAAAGLLQVLRRPRSERDELDVMLMAWVSTCALFLLVSLFTPLDVRYYLAVAPAVAVLAGCTVARSLATAAPPGRALALCLVVLVVGQGVWYVVRFFGTVLPR